MTLRLIPSVTTKSYVSWPCPTCPVGIGTEARNGPVRLEQPQVTVFPRRQKVAFFLDFLTLKIFPMLVYSQVADI